MEALIPIKVSMPTVRITIQGQRDDNLELERQLDWENEVRENTTIRMASYCQRVVAHYNKNARPRIFQTGILVLKIVFENTVEVGVGKLQAYWEGPYVVTKVGNSGAYHLLTLDGVPLLRPWNVFSLKQYYQ